MRHRLCRPATLQRMIRKEKLTAARNDDIEMVPPHQVFQMPQVGSKRYKIVAFRLIPKALKSRVVDENVPCVWGIRSVFKIEIASVQCQGFAVDIECD